MISPELAGLEGLEKADRLLEMAEQDRKRSPSRSLERASEALQIAQIQGCQDRIVRARTGIGLAHLERGQSAEALEQFLANLSRHQEEGDRQREAGALGRIGLANYASRQFEQAREFLERSLELCRELEDRGGCANHSNSLGLVYLELDEPERALTCFQQALEVGRELELPGLIRNAINNLGITHFLRNDYPQAIQAFRESIRLKEPAGDLQGIAGGWINIGRCHVEMEEWDQAREYLSRGLEQAEGSEAWSFVRNALYNLWLLHERVGDLPQALEAAHRHQEASDRLYQEESSRRMAEMQARYDTERALGEARFHRDRSSELEDRLRQAQKLEALGRLAGGVAHDFNNLLTAISGSSELLKEEIDPEGSAGEFLREIQRGTDLASELTRRLLTFSRKQVIQPRRLSLNEVLDQAERMIRRIIGEDIELLIDREPDLRPVLVDGGQLEQVIMNLVVNARDAMPRGGMLLLDTANDGIEEPQATALGLPPGPYVRFTVTDTGCGMDEATRQLIFEPFFTTKERGRGTGLGLSMVYGVIQQSSGAVELDTAPNAGASFRIYLPAVRGEIQEPPRLDPAREAVGGTETILLVEDDEMVRKVAQEALKRQGYHVLIAPSGEEALRVAGGHNGAIHLLITDVVLPRMDGPTLAQRLAVISPSTRVLFMSGYTDESIHDLGTCMEEGCFLSKPFTLEQLGRAVRGGLEGERGDSRFP